MFYRVNMADFSVKQEDRPQYQGLGGRALSSRIIAAEVDSNVHALSAENKLIFVTGLLTGTGAPNTGRMSLGAKSPLTGTIKESNVGGSMGYKLGRLGVRGIIVEGLPAEEGDLYVLHISAAGGFLHALPELRGLNIYDTVAKLQERFGSEVAIGCIGSAGENKMASACVGFTDMEGVPSHQAGRGGIGAVMGSKSLKALVCDDGGAENVRCVDEAAFRRGAQKLAKALLMHPATGQAIPPAGREVLKRIINEPDLLGCSEDDHAGSRLLLETTNEPEGRVGHSCLPGCLIGCAHSHNNKKKLRPKRGETETCWGFGPNLGINNLEDVALMNRLCDDYGVDAIEMAVSLGIVTEAGVAAFGDGKAAVGLIQEVGKATYLGRILGAGAETVGKVFGVRRVPVVKGQGIPAYDPRALKGVGVTYATSTMGADHTAGYAVGTNLPQAGEGAAGKKEGQVVLSRNLQIATAFFDSAGLCLFVAAAVLDIPEGLEGIVEMCNARHGWAKTLEDYLETGKQVLREERAFNRAAGIADGADNLPDFFRTEPLAPDNVVYDISKEELNKLFDF